MPWETPKTDWYGAVDGSGNYQGDRFNATDYNRIKNNLNMLYDLAIKVYPIFNVNDLGEDKVAGDYFYADEMNKMEENLATINANTYNYQIGESPNYQPNGMTMNFDDLNRLESYTLQLYEGLMNEMNGLRMFIWNFGFKGGEL